MFRDYELTDETFDAVPLETVYIPADIPSVDVRLVFHGAYNRLCIGSPYMLWMKRKNFTSADLSGQNFPFILPLTGISPDPL